MALVDANYKFIFIDIGQYGSNADGPVFMKSDFGYLYLNDLLDIPGPKQLPGAAHLGALPHVIIADEAFPLKPTIMCPYPRGKNAHRLAQEKQIFNLRLSRACRIVGNAFGMYTGPKIQAVQQVSTIKCGKCGQSGQSLLCTAQLLVRQQRY